MFIKKKIHSLIKKFIQLIIMELTIKLNLDKNVHSKNELIEASKYLKLLSQHFEVNIIQKKGTLGKDKTFFKFNTDMPINDKKDNKIGFYRINKKVIKKEETIEESIKDFNKTMCEWFGYTDQKGNYYYDGKLLLKANEDPEEWED